MKLFLRILGWLFGWKSFSDEAWDRFMVPQISRARAGGISDERIGEMLQEAVDDSDFAMHFPGTNLRDLVDAELGEKPASE